MCYCVNTITERQRYRHPAPTVCLFSSRVSLDWSIPFAAVKGSLLFFLSSSFRLGEGSTCCFPWLCLKRIAFLDISRQKGRKELFRNDWQDSIAEKKKEAGRAELKLAVTIEGNRITDLQLITKRHTHEGKINKNGALVLDSDSHSCYKQDKNRWQKKHLYERTHKKKKKIEWKKTRLYVLEEKKKKKNWMNHIISLCYTKVHNCS